VEHGSRQEDDMPAVDHSTARHAAVAELFDALEALLILYKSVPEADRVEEWSAQAERITGELGRHLHAARSRLPAVVRVSSAPTAE
jgi:hypothetical protein